MQQVSADLEAKCDARQLQSTFTKGAVLLSYLPLSPALVTGRQLAYFCPQILIQMVPSAGCAAMAEAGPGGRDCSAGSVLHACAAARLG